MSNASDFIIEIGVLKKYIGSGGDVIIPEGIMEIGSNACSYAQLESVTIPEGVVKIGMGAFSGNRLNRVTLPKSLREIGTHAFGMCGGLEEIIIPYGVKKIGSKAFNHCVRLCNVVVSDSVTVVGSDAFADTKWLKNQSDDMVFAGKVLIRAKSVAEEITIPKGTSGIGGSAFNGCENVQKVVLPESVQTIETKAFASCKKLEWVRIEGNPEIAKDAIPEKAVLIAPQISFDTIKSKSMKHQTAIGFFFLHEELHTIPEGIVKYVIKNFDKMLPDIQKVPELLERMLNYDVLQIEQIDRLFEVLQENVHHRALLLEYKNKRFSNEQIQKQAAMQEKKQTKMPTAAEMKKIWKPKTLPYGTLETSGYYGSETIVTIPAVIGKKQVTRVGSCCFYVSPFDDNNRKEITMILVPEGVTSVGDRAFVGCEKLLQIHIPATLVKIEEYAFWKCSNVTIHAPAGSYAETYAKENNIPFVVE